MLKVTKVLTQKYQDHVPYGFAYKVVCVDDRFTKPIVVYKGEHAPYEFIKAIFKEYKYCKKVMNKHFNKNLIMSEEEEHLFQQSNSCWICKNLLITMKKKLEIIVIWLVNLEALHIGIVKNLQLTKKVPVIFQNLRGYNSHLTFNELDKFDVKISVIPNELEDTWHFFFE